MTPMEKMRTALQPLGLPVYAIAARLEDTQIPDDYIVLTPVDERADLYAGNQDEQASMQLRVSWYSINGNRGHGASLRQLGRAAEFTVVSCFETFDVSRKRYVVHQEFWIESEE